MLNILVIVNTHFQRKQFQMYNIIHENMALKLKDQPTKTIKRAA